MSVQTESRAALRELINLLEEVDERWASPEYNIASEADVVGAHRVLMHILEGGLSSFFECDPTDPDFRHFVTSSRKFTGDNGDALYFDAPVSPGYEYEVRGTMNGAVYFSLTIELNSADGIMSTDAGGTITNTDMDIDENGDFALCLGGPMRERNWLPLPEGASRILTRHYFENEMCAGHDPAARPRMSIQLVSNNREPRQVTDESVAAGIRRVANFVRSRTLDFARMAENPPAFVGLEPNKFPQPVVPGDFGLAVFDAHYSLAPFMIAPDEALVITGRWPECVFANVCLWNRFQQTLDYRNRSVSLNRKQTRLEADGSFRIVIAHEDPGTPNWLDTEGNPFGLVFWRYIRVTSTARTTGGAAPSAITASSSTSSWLMVSPGASRKRTTRTSSTVSLAPSASSASSPAPGCR